jgi:hypothetical protein
MNGLFDSNAEVRHISAGKLFDCIDLGRLAANQAFFLFGVVVVGPAGRA